MDKQIMI